MLQPILLRLAQEFLYNALSFFILLFREGAS
jgi:hypothetical protein